MRTADLGRTVKNEVGGVGSILYTLFHIIDVEYSWVRGIQGKGDLVIHFENYKTPEKLKSLSDEFRKDINDFLETNLDDLKGKVVTVPWDDEAYTADEIVHHIVAHEIHHIGQLSIWSRELGLKHHPLIL